jgi:opacity protein-like surface antigen
MKKLMGAAVLLTVLTSSVAFAQHDRGSGQDQAQGQAYHQDQQRNDNQGSDQNNQGRDNHDQHHNDYQSSDQNYEGGHHGHRHEVCHRYHHHRHCAWVWGRG